MRSTLFLPAVAIGLLATSAGAQVTPRALRITREASPRAAIGISTSSSASARDTLGLLVTAITPKGPAERAGIEEGNRIATINGTSLRLSAGDVGDWEMQGIMQRRLTREMGKVKPGDEVELRVYAGGQFRTIPVKTVDSDDLYRERGAFRALRARRDERPTLGLGIGSTGSRRDTLGVFVMFVNDSGPAARAGIIEGDRIAAINGVDVRVSRTDAGDPEVGGAKARRLEREIAGMQPGDDADLRVWSNGQFRNVKVKVARSSDLPRRRSSFIYMGGGGFGVMPPMPPMTPMPVMPPIRELDIEVPPAALVMPMRRAIEQAVESTRRAMEGVSRTLVIPRVFEWDDADAAFAPEVPAAPESRTHARPTPAPTMRRPAAGRSASTGIAGGWYAPAIAAVGYGEPVTAMPAVAWSGPAEDGATIVIDGLRLAPVNPELARYLGSGSDRGALVLAAPSWASGIHAGDVITAIDGTPVRDGAGLSISIDRSRPTTITYLRGGKRHDARITVSR